MAIFTIFSEFLREAQVVLSRVAPPISEILVPLLAASDGPG
jgi:hypothetical protein